MNDLETRLGSALRAKGADAPVAPDLAASARERRRWQIRTRYGTGLGVAAAVAAGVLIVPGVTGGGEDPDGSGPVLTTEGQDWIPAGWRSETVGEVELAVPGDMPYGDMSQWCGAEDPEPLFWRQGGASTLMACTPTYTFGVTVVPSGDDQLGPYGDDFDDPANFPEGAVVEQKVLGDHRVIAVFESEQVAEDVIATAHLNRGVDANGCPTTEPIAELGLAATVGAEGGPISVCRYSGEDRANLLQSERLSAADSDAARAAIASAPAGTGPDDSEDQCFQAPGESETEAVLFRTETGAYAWVHYDLCRGHAVDLGSSTKKLTPEVMRWALSPGWSGGMSASGLLDDLRRDPNLAPQ